MTVGANAGCSAPPSFPLASGGAGTTDGSGALFDGGGCACRSDGADGGSVSVIDLSIDVRNMHAGVGQAGSRCDVSSDVTIGRRESDVSSHPFTQIYSV